MSRAFFTRELDCVAAFWRIYRRDGVTLGFTSHDRDLAFDGITHRAAPGLLPSAIRRTAGWDGDSAEMRGALTHDSIRAADLLAGRFDDAAVEAGAVDWETKEAAILFTGTIGETEAHGQRFAAQLRPAKDRLALDPVPRTSPTCRARFCGPGCNLSPASHSVEARLTALDADRQRVVFHGIDPALYARGELRWLDGPASGLDARILATDGGALVLDRLPESLPGPGTPALLREGCDHTIATCAARFGNAANFRGEPRVPGNDLLSRHPA